MEYNVTKSIKEQGELCQRKGYPHFAPSNGRCWSCGKNVYESIDHTRKDAITGLINGSYATGISVEKAGTELVTGCPHCNRSYCE